MPERVLTNADLEKLVETSNEWIIERTGIRERRIAAEGETSSDMATAAARRALETAEMDAAELDLIIVATVTPDMPQWESEWIEVRDSLDYYKLHDWPKGIGPMPPDEIDYESSGTGF